MSRRIRSALALLAGNTIGLLLASLILSGFAIKLLIGIQR